MSHGESKVNSSLFIYFLSWKKMCSFRIVCERKKVTQAARWLALLPHSARDPGSIPGLGHCLRGVCMFSPCVCVGFLRLLRFPPTVRTMCSFRWTGRAKLPGGLAGYICGVTGLGTGWDCCRSRFDGPNGLLLHCGDSRESHGAGKALQPIGSAPTITATKDALIPFSCTCPISFPVTFHPNVS